MISHVIRKPAPLGAGFLLLLATSAPAQVSTGAQYLARMDANRDGRVALAEYQDWLGYAFERMDFDHDGVLRGAELPGRRGREVTRAEHRETLASAFRRQDRNQDGWLDAAELAAPPR